MANLNDDTFDYVYTSVGITKNLGSYESLRIDAGIRRAIRPGESEAEAWDAAWSEVEAQLEAKITEADNSLKK